MSDARTELANAVIETALAMERRGINNGMSGNVSVRVGADDSADGRACFLVTPSSVAYDELTTADIVEMQFAGDAQSIPEWRAGNDRRPSSEWRFHHDILAARPDANAVVHAHPINATALAIHGRGIGALHYMVGIAGGHDIRCAPYATFGTPELSANAVAALADRKACLLAHHGIIAIGRDLRQALDIAVEVEVLAAQFLAASALGEPDLLTTEQMNDVLDKMSSGQGYGSS